MNVKIKKINPSAILPEYKTDHSSGADLYACLEKECVVKPMETLLVPTGIAMEIPEGYEGQVRPRSGLALQGIILPNSPGTIDSDYRGEIKVLIMNLGGKSFRISPRDRIAQIVFQKIHKAGFTPVMELQETGRGPGGFGSTGSN
jgi:dUTP pyrophosphatase